MAVNSWVVSAMRYGAEILIWNTDELKSLDIRTRKLVKMHRVLHPQSNIDRVYINRELGGRGLIICEGFTRMQETTWNVMSGIQLNH